MIICLEQGANDLHVVQLTPLPPYHLLLHYNPDWFNLSNVGSAYPGCPGKEAVKRRSVSIPQGMHDPVIMERDLQQ